MTGGPCATQGFGRLAVRPAQACAETSSRGIVPERSGSTHQVCGQFRDAVAGMRGYDTAPMPSRCDFLRAAREDSPAGKRNGWSASCSAEP